MTACLACVGCFKNRSRPADVLTVTSLSEFEGITNSTKRAEIVRLFLRGAPRRVTDADLKDLSETNLQQLDLSEIKDKTGQMIPEEVWRLKGLTSFWFVRNKLAAIPDKVADLPELTYLNLDGNEITAIPDALARATKLRWLRLNGNQISELPGSLAALKDMRRLYMRQNKLTAVPEVVKEWPELEDLVLDGNDITSVPDWVGTDLPQLKSLSLRGCKKITSLPKDLSGLRNLSVLNVADCSFPSEEVERIRKRLGDNVVILF